MKNQPSSNENEPQRFVTLNELVAEFLPPGVAHDLSEATLQKSAPPRHWWMMLVIIAGWITLSAAVSAVLFRVTGSYFAFSPVVVAMGVTPQLITTVFRVLFWSPADYALEALKTMRGGGKYFRQFPQA